MEILNNDILQYSENHSTPENALLKKINHETYLKVLMPNMLSGHLQGRVLSIFSQMVKPAAILEIGTYTGYSALCLAEGLTDDGKIITIDINEELENTVRGYFNESIYKYKIDYRVGNAVQIIPGLTETFDIVFIDADKMNYIIYYDLIFDKVRKGGYIIADNVLWKGKLIDEKFQNDKDTINMIAFNKKINEDIRVENVLFPIRDGLMVARKTV